VAQEAAQRAAREAALREVRALAEALDERERNLRQRERELAEQRRVLVEEYRLLRNRTAAPPAVTPSSPVALASRFEPAPRTGVWQWLKRIMLGVSTS
jgi:hypothetical protein